jgi:hypothetical protein
MSPIWIGVNPLEARALIDDRREARGLQHLRGPERTPAGLAAEDQLRVGGESLLDDGQEVGVGRQAPGPMCNNGTLNAPVGWPARLELRHRANVEVRVAFLVGELAVDRA